MRNYCWILILMLCVSGLSSCQSDAEKYEDVLREGSWYVYDIDYSYELYDRFETPELVNFFHYLLEDQMLLFIPGDELTFSKRRIEVRCPDGDKYWHNYYFYGDYIRVGQKGDYMGLLPDGDIDNLTLTFADQALIDMLYDLASGDEYYAYLLEAAYRNLREFHITYRLQRPVPEMAQVIPGIYIGPMYDGDQQLLNEAATLNLFWEKNRMNLTLDDKVILEDESGSGPQFYVEILDLQVKNGLTPGSYEFSGEQLLNDSRFGPVDIRILNGRYNAAGTVAVELEIVWKENVYVLDFQKGIKRWEFQNMQVKSAGKAIVLKE